MKQLNFRDGTWRECSRASKAGLGVSLAADFSAAQKRQQACKAGLKRVKKELTR